VTDAAALTDTAGIVLAGGRSTRMGAAKAALEWHGSTLLRRTVAIVGRAVDGPVVVVRAPGQELPALPAGTLVAEDPREGKGPVQGIAAGLAALEGRAAIAFAASTDMPFLHPAFVGRVLRALADSGAADVALPRARGYRQPLAAAYRVSLAAAAGRLASQDLLRPAFLFAECEVTLLDEAALLRDPVLAALDPDLESVVNVNTPDEYRAARARPAPEVTVRLRQAAHAGDRRDVTVRDVSVRAAAVGAAARAAGLGTGGDAVPPRGHAAVLLNGDRVGDDPEIPLVAGDVVTFLLR
jgi:molybdopterin-guanine dinucleotide biosynthesis protein A